MQKDTNNATIHSKNNKMHNTISNIVLCIMLNFAKIDLNFAIIRH